MIRLQRQWKLVGACALLGLLSIYCRLAGSGGPRVETYPQPTLTIQMDPFEDVGCPSDDSGFRRCPPESPMGALGCKFLRNPGDMLGGLNPAMPLVVCILRGKPGERLATDQYIYREGCLLPDYVRYIVRSENGFKSVNNLADLQALYAPIESDVEALSYALAATGLGVRYNLQATSNYRYFTDRLQDTHVKAVPEGYEVLLYDYKLCGCGPHPTFAVTVLVTSDGQVLERSRVKVFEDPAEDRLCVD